jgi:hypothetical protein
MHDPSIAKRDAKHPRLCAVRRKVGTVGHNDVDRCVEVIERALNRHREVVVALNDPIENDEQVDVAIRAIVATRHGTEQNDLCRRERGDDAIDRNWNPFGERPAAPEGFSVDDLVRERFHGIIFASLDDETRHTQPVQ